MINYRHMLLKDLSRQLRQVRIAKGLSQTDVALQVNISLKELHRLEEGEVIGFKKYLSLVHFYGKEMTFVLADKR